MIIRSLRIKNNKMESAPVNLPMLCLRPCVCGPPVIFVADFYLILSFCLYEEENIIGIPKSLKYNFFPLFFWVGGNSVEPI